MATKIKTTAKRSKNWQYYNDLLLCCIPLLALSFFMYGARVLLLCGVAIVTAYVCDRLLAPLHAPGYETQSNNSICFAVLLTLLLPASISYQVLITAVVFTVLLGKEVFGGSENYPFHPTAVGYVITAISWPDQVFRYPRIGVLPLWDASGVTVVESASSTLRNGGLPTTSAFNLLLGNYVGPLGTGCVLVILACSLFLLLRKDIRLAAPVSFLIACALVVWLLPRAGDLPERSFFWTNIETCLMVLRYEMLSGAIPFAAVFLITEPATSPNSRSSCVLYGFVLGILTMMFRYYGTYETGVCFAILVVDAISDWLDLASARLFEGRAAQKPAQKAATPPRPAKAPAKKKPAAPSGQPAKAPARRPADLPAAAAATLDTDATRPVQLDTQPRPAAAQETRVMPKLDPAALQAVKNSEKARQEAAARAKSTPGRKARRRAAAAAAAAAATPAKPTDTMYMHTVMIPRIKEVKPNADSDK